MTTDPEPTTIEVLVLPEDGSPRRLVTVQTLNEETRPLGPLSKFPDRTTPVYEMTDYYRALVAGVHTVCYSSERSPHPLSRTGMRSRYDFFFAGSGRKLGPNPHADDRIAGDVFLLRVSKPSSSRTRFFYHDGNVVRREDVGKFSGGFIFRHRRWRRIGIEGDYGGGGRGIIRATYWVLANSVSWRRRAVTSGITRCSVSVQRMYSARYHVYHFI